MAGFYNTADTEYPYHELIPRNKLRNEAWADSASVGSQSAEYGRCTREFF